MRKFIYLKFFSGFVIFFIIFSSHKSETDYKKYYECIYIADSLFYAGNYNDSSLKYQEAFNNYTPINFTRFKEYEFYLRSIYLSNKREGLNKGVHSLILDYGYNFDDFKKDSILYNIFLKSDVDMYDFKFMRKKYLKNIKISLREKVISLIEKDNLNKTSTEEKKVKDSIKNEIAIELYNIIETNGYPNERLIGNKNIDNKNVEIDNIILYSMNDSLQNLLEPILKKQFSIGNIDSYKYASFIDFFRRRKKQPQEYGIYGGYEIKEGININKQRREIGLEPLGNLIKINN